MLNGKVSEFKVIEESSNLEQFGLNCDVYIEDVDFFLFFKIIFKQKYDVTFNHFGNKEYEDSCNEPMVLGERGPAGIRMTKSPFAYLNLKPKSIIKLIGDKYRFCSNDTDYVELVPTEHIHDCETGYCLDGFNCHIDVRELGDWDEKGVIIQFEGCAFHIYYMTKKDFLKIIKSMHKVRNVYDNEEYRYYRANPNVELPNEFWQKVYNTIN